MNTIRLDYRIADNADVPHIAVVVRSTPMDDAAAGGDDILLLEATLPKDQKRARVLVDAVCTMVDVCNMSDEPVMQAMLLRVMAPASGGRQ